MSQATPATQNATMVNNAVTAPLHAEPLIVPRQRYALWSRIRANLYGRGTLIAEAMIALTLLAAVLVFDVWFFTTHAHEDIVSALADSFKLLTLQKCAQRTAGPPGRWSLHFQCAVLRPLHPERAEYRARPAQQTRAGGTATWLCCRLPQPCHRLRAWAHGLACHYAAGGVRHTGGSDRAQLPERDGAARDRYARASGRGRGAGGARAAQSWHFQRPRRDRLH